MRAWAAMSLFTNDLRLRLRNPLLGHSGDVPAAVS